MVSANPNKGSSKPQGQVQAPESAHLNRLLPSWARGATSDPLVISVLLPPTSLTSAPNYFTKPHPGRVLTSPLQSFDELTPSAQSRLEQTCRAWLPLLVTDNIKVNVKQEQKESVTTGGEKERASNRLRGEREQIKINSWCWGELKTPGKVESEELVSKMCTKERH